MPEEKPTIDGLIFSQHRQQKALAPFQRFQQKNAFGFPVFYYGNITFTEDFNPPMPFTEEVNIQINPDGLFHWKELFIVNQSMSQSKIAIQEEIYIQAVDISSNRFIIRDPADIRAIGAPLPQYGTPWSAWREHFHNIKGLPIDYIMRQNSAIKFLFTHTNSSAGSGNDSRIDIVLKGVNYNIPNLIIERS